MPSRLPIASTCLLLSTLGFLSLGWSLYGRGGAWQLWGSLLCIYAAGVYVALGFMSINLKAWAWRFSCIAFGVHIFSVLPLAYRSLNTNWMVQAAVAVWAAIGLFGLWALLCTGTRAAVEATTNARS